MENARRVALWNAQGKTNKNGIVAWCKETKIARHSIPKMQNTTLEEQRIRIQTAQPEVKLVAACKAGEGIIQIPNEKHTQLRQRFYYTQASKAYFVPASGSGSRMFEFLFDFLEAPTEDNRGAVERFLNHVEDFAFFHQFPIHIQEQLRQRTMDIEAFVAYILNNNGMGLAHLPKGLVPFHKHGPFLLNPFHEHVLQGMEVTHEDCHFHFTIRPNFQQRINEQLTFLEGLTGKQFAISFSVQNPHTDAYAFTSDGEIALCENGSALRRPAGHGALLENLQQVNADLIFLKNIDNVQHLDKSEEAIKTQQMLAGLLLEAHDAMVEVLKNPSHAAVVELNHIYQLYDPKLVEQSSLETLITLLERPLRVCGMVRNEGQSGGGPFWIEDNGVVSKQIVEKAQINMRGDQYRVMIQSTHFNPVLMVCQGRNWDGTPIDFEKYRDNSKYFVVNKRYRGRDIRFMELPGLWNGSMAHWNSIFVEVYSETFSPVKTILDLLDASHQG